MNASTIDPFSAMAISLTGKIVITVLVLAVIGGMTATIVLIVNDSSDIDTPTTTPETTTEGVTEPVEDMPYQVGVGIADMTGPCAEITFVSILSICMLNYSIAHCLLQQQATQAPVPTKRSDQVTVPINEPRKGTDNSDLARAGHKARIQGPQIVEGYKMQRLPFNRKNEELIPDIINGNSQSFCLLSAFSLVGLRKKGNFNVYFSHLLKKKWQIYLKKILR